MKLTLTFDNISEAHAMTLIKAAKLMEYCGKIGASRDITVFADGDGDFRPKVSYDTDKALPMHGSKYAMDMHIWKYMEDGDNFYLDPDELAWQLPSPDFTPTKLEGVSEEMYDQLAKKYNIVE